MKVNATVSKIKGHKIRRKAKRLNFIFTSKSNPTPEHVIWNFNMMTALFFFCSYLHLRTRLFLNKTEIVHGQMTYQGLRVLK